jgi:hypothetical protein
MSTSKLYTLLALVMLTTVGMAQSNLDQFFDRHATNEQLEAFQLDAELLKTEMQSEQQSSDTEAREAGEQVSEMLDQFEFMQILVVEGENATTELTRTLYNDANRLINRDAAFEPLIEVSSSETNVRAMIKGADMSSIEELVVILQEEEDVFAFIRFSGDFDMSNAMEYAQAASSMGHIFEAVHFGPTEGEQARVGEINVEQINVFPNPSEGTFQISYQVSKQTELNWYVVDASARVIEISNTVTLQPGKHNFSWTAPAAGIYNLVFETPEGKVAQQLIVAE